MKRFIYAYIGLLIGLCSLTANAQTGTGSIFDTPEDQRDEAWQARRDSLAKLHRDNGDMHIEIGCVGDVLTGYDIVFDTIGCHASYDRYGRNPGYYTHFKIYHVDKAMRKVRQVVVLREKWPNTPVEILADNGGFKLAAVTAREYIELNRADAIYGEEWDICLPSGVKEKDSIPNVPGYEITVLERGFETMERYGRDFVEHTKEIMSFSDTIQGEPRKFLCAAHNLIIGRADYTTGRSYYPSDESNFILGRPDKNDYWWRKYFDDIRQQQQQRAFRQRMWTAAFTPNRQTLKSKTL